MPDRKQFLRFATFVCLSAATLLAVFVPTPGTQSIPPLFKTSALVFKGEITSVSEVGESHGQWYGQSTRLKLFRATAKIDRLYKGQVPGGVVTISYERPEQTVCSVSPCPTFAVGDYNLFFLSAGSENYRLADRFFGKFIVSRLNSSKPAAGLDRLESDLAAGLRDSNPLHALRTIELFAALENVSSTQPLLDGLTTADFRLQVAIHTALLRLRDYRKLPDAISFLEIPTPDPEVQMLQYRSSHYIEGIRDPHMVRTLTRLARSRSDRLREAAIHALRKIGEPESVPTLVAALSDPVWGVRYDAAMALATIESRPDLAASVDEFKQTESKYVGAWEQWWRTEGKAKYDTNGSQ